MILNIGSKKIIRICVISFLRIYRKPVAIGYGLCYDIMWRMRKTARNSLHPFTPILHQTAVQMGIMGEKCVEQRETAEISIIMLHNSDCSVFSSFHRQLTCFVHI